MSDLDSLIVTFQTQISDVMETVVRTAMFEVTRLVEDSFMQELKRRNQEVESLRIQLQWAERKLGDREGKGGGADGANGDVDLFSDMALQTPGEEQDDILRDGGVKNEDNSAERWTSSQQEVIPEMPPSADRPASTHCTESQATEETDPAVDVKREQLNKPSCSSVLLVGWGDILDDQAGDESNGATEPIETQPEQTQENGEESLRNIIKQDPQFCTAYVLHEEREETQMATDARSEVDGGWTGLTGLTVTTAGSLQNHSLAPERDCDPAQTRGPLQETDNTADVNVLVAPTSAPPTTGPHSSDALGATIKQEVIVDSDECVEVERRGKKMKKSGMASFLVRQHRLSSEPFKQNHVSHKANAQEAMKLHSKVGAGLRLHAAIQHLHRPVKKPPHAPSNSTAAAALSGPHSQVVNLNPLHRSPSTSKAAPPPPTLSVQRVHLGNKSSHNRSGASWVSIKTQLQSANSHHQNPFPHPDSHPYTAGPRHLLRCGQCGKCFPHPSNLKAHLQTHTGERPFCCSLCGRSFTKLSNLKAHRRVHTGERPYSCSACGKCFTQKCNLKRHQRIHVDGS